MNDVRIALATLHSPFGKTQQNLERIISYAEEAARQNVKIICFPELSITGYGNGNAIFEKAVGIDGEITSILSSCSRDYKITILCGLAEKVSDNRIAATHLVVFPDGIIRKYRKLHLAPPEIDTYSSGSEIPVFESCGLKFGIQLCYDAHFPALSTQMALMGVDAIFMPHASPRGTSEEKFNSWMRHLTARAFDNGIFVAAVNQCGDNENGLMFPGLSIVISPSGEVLKKDVTGSEGLLIADLEKKDLDAVRSHRMRYFLPNRRTDLYK